MNKNSKETESHCCSHDHDDKPKQPIAEENSTTSESQKEAEKLVGKGFTKTEFIVDGMDCQEEVAALSNEFRKENSIKSFEIQLLNGKAVVIHENSLGSQKIVERITAAGLKVRSEHTSNKNLVVYLLPVCFALWILGWLLHFLQMNSISNGLFVLAALVGIWTFLPKVYRSIKNLNLDMYILMTVATSGAVALGDYSEGATVIFLFLISEFLEGLSVRRVRAAIREVMDLVPERVLLKRQENWVESAPSDAQVGDIFRVRPGDRIALDGKVLSGESNVDESTLTGEARPILKLVGESVYAGTLNNEGLLDIEVKKAFNESRIANISKLIESAQNEKAPAQRFVDSFAKIYTPAVFIVALLTFALLPFFMGTSLQEAFYKAIVFLVIACPCALVISTPVAIVTAITSLAKKGVLIKSGLSLETLSRVKAICFDKTGTLTKGQMEVTKVTLMSNTAEDKLLSISGSIEEASSHPIATAIKSYVNNKKANILPVTGLRTTHGRGIEADIEGHKYFLGNHHFAHDIGVCSNEFESFLSAQEKEGFTSVVVGHYPHGGCVGEVMGVLAIGDTVRPETSDVLQKLKNLGVNHLFLLSGDNEIVAKKIASDVGISEVYGNLLPDQKVEKLKEIKLKIGITAMIGDGVNDAPALAVSDIGISIGQTGSDIAIENSDVTLAQGNLTNLPLALKVSQRAKSIIIFNISFALAIKAIFIVGNIAGFSSLWLAILADTGATLIVILNSLRLLK